MPLNPTLTESNPNDITGGGGSLAGPTHDQDATGPWLVWPNQEYENYISPYAVVAASEVRLMAQMLADYEAGELEPLSGGESSEVPPEQLHNVGVRPGAGPESPVFEVNPEADIDQSAAFILAFTQE